MMSTTVNVHEAKTTFSKLLERVRRGEEVIVAKAGKPVARPVPFESARPERRPGSARGMIEISSHFDAPLPEDILDSFEA